MNTTLCVRITSQNSTVNGSPANPNHPAARWFDGWRNLGIKDSRVYVDGNSGLGKIHKDRIESQASCGEYLHVPVLGKDADGRWYRVRSRLWVGKKYGGRKILAVEAKKLSQWCWVYTLEER